jgi:hypothetical protein
VASTGTSRCCPSQALPASLTSQRARPSALRQGLEVSWWQHHCMWLCSWR